MISKKKAIEIIGILESMFPNAECELIHRNDFELLIAVLLSAQTTDAAVNKITPSLFQRFKDVYALNEADLGDIEESIRTIGLYRNKAKHIKNLSKILIDEYQGEVPKTQEELEHLPGVGRKTANVVRSVAFGEAAIAVDTHVERVSKRLGIANLKDTPLEVEKKLMRLLPIELWSRAHHLFIFFGRYHCTAKKPRCLDCPLFEQCKSKEKRLQDHL